MYIWRWRGRNICNMGDINISKDKEYNFKQYRYSRYINIYNFNTDSV